MSPQPLVFERKRARIGRKTARLRVLDTTLGELFPDALATLYLATKEFQVIIPKGASSALKAIGPEFLQSLFGNKTKE